MNVEGQSRTFEEQKKFDNFVMTMGAFFQNSKNQALEIDEYVNLLLFRKPTKSNCPTFLKNYFHTLTNINKRSRKKASSEKAYQLMKKTKLSKN